MSELAKRALEGLAPEFEVIDAHAHWGDWTIYDTVTADDRFGEMDRLGIRLSVVSSLLALEGEVARGHDQLAQALQTHAGRLIGYVVVNAAADPDGMLGELEKRLENPAFCGIKMYQQGVAYDDPVYDDIFALAAERALPVLAHTTGGRLTGLEKMAARHPGAPVLAAHAGSGMKIQAYIDAAGQAENLLLDLTYSRGYVNAIERFVDAVGPERVIWGTDAPLFSMAQQMGKVLFARISDSDKQMILRDNAVRIFNL